MAVLLTACLSSNPALNTPLGIAEQTDTANNNAYAQFVGQIDTALADGKISQATHDAEQRAAWSVLQLERTQYQTFRALQGGATNTVTP
jgi:hypothetical protein